MMTQILVCCRCCGAQSMWYDVVSSLPCLVKWMLVVISFIFLFKYLVEGFKVYYGFKVNHSKAIDELRREKEELENLLTQQKLANVENRTREELQVCKEISKQREALWKSYKEQIEKLCDKSHKCCKEVADSAGSAEE